MGIEDPDEITTHIKTHHKTPKATQNINTKDNPTENEMMTNPTEKKKK